MKYIRQKTKTHEDLKVIEVTGDVNEDIYKYIAQNFPETKKASKNNIDEHLRVIRTIEGAEFEVVVQYHNKLDNKTLYFDQHIGKEHLEGLVAKMHPGADFKIHIGGKGKKEVSKQLADYFPVESHNGTPISEGYISKKIKLRNKLGFHARAAASFVDIAGKYDGCRIGVLNGTEPSVSIENFGGINYNDGHSIISLLTMAAECGTELMLAVEGDKAKEAMSDLTNLIENKFGED